MKTFAAGMVLAATLWGLGVLAPRGAGSAMFRGKLVHYQVWDGLAIAQGDIVLGTLGASAPAGGGSLWPGSVIPYIVDSGFPDPQRITGALKYWEGAAVRLVARTFEQNWVRFARNNAAPCSSQIGMQGGEQKINVPDTCSQGAIAHEIGHAAGLLHTHEREDRDLHVRVLYENLDKRLSFNFAQEIGGGDIGPYDYGSLMHYSAYAGTRNGNPVLETIPPGIPIGQRDALSPGDIDALRRLYGQAPTDTTVATNPPGLRVEVDGRTVTTPATFSWAPGTAHTVRVPSPQGSGAARYSFCRWSDGGAQSHQVTALAEETVLVAHFVRSYLLKTAAGAGGTVRVSPASADGYYPENTPISVTAAPAEGAWFFRWSGAGYFPEHGSAANPAKFLLRDPGVSYTASFAQAPVTTIGTRPAGIQLTVDSETSYGPQNFLWTLGTLHDVSVGARQQPSFTDSVRYSFVNWSDGNGSRTRAVAASSSTATYTANFQTEYLVTAEASPASGGDVSLSPASADGYYAAGSRVTVTAIPGGEFRFAGWGGDGAGQPNPAQVDVNDQARIIAGFLVPRVLYNGAAVNAASYGFGAVAPGEIVSIFGLEIGPPTAAQLELSPEGKVSAQLQETQVLFDGIAAPLIYVSSGQISAVVPYGVAGKGSTTLSVVPNGQPARNTLRLAVGDTAPALFTADSSGRGQGAILNEDFSVNSAANPAVPGSVIMLYGTGEGQTEPRGIDGSVAVSTLPRPLLDVKVRIGRKPAEVLYAGAAPRMVAGVFQINARVPADAPSGSATVVVTVGEASSPASVTVAIR